MILHLLQHWPDGIPSAHSAITPVQHLDRRLGIVILFDIT